MKNKKGISIIAAIFIMLLMGTFAGLFTFLVSSYYGTIALDFSAAQAFYIAEAGIEWAIKNQVPTTSPVYFAGGSFTVTQNGNLFTSVSNFEQSKTFLKITIPAAAIPTLNVQPISGPAGTIILITGTGFNSSEQINLVSSKYGTESPVIMTDISDTDIYSGDLISGPSNEIITANNNGDFCVTWDVIWNTDPGGVSVPYEIDTAQGSSDPEPTAFTVTQATGYVILLQPISGYPGTPITITGYGLSPNTDYRIGDNSGRLFKFLVDIDNGNYDGDIVSGAQSQNITTDSSGGFEISSRANWTWSSGAGNTRVIDIRGGSFTAGAAFTTLRPLLTLFPDSGGENTIVTITGNGFYANSSPETRIGITYDDTLDNLINLTDTPTYSGDSVGGASSQNITADASGNFEVTWTVSSVNLKKASSLIIGDHYLDTSSTQDPQSVLFQITRPGVKDIINIIISGRVQAIAAGSLNDTDDPDTNFPDIVIGTWTSNNTGNVEVWLNTADETGTVTQHQVFAANNFVNDLELSAIDRADTDDDIIVGNNATSAGGNEAIEIWINDGTGIFTEDNNSPYNASGRVQSVARFDMDGDDTADIIYASSGNPSRRRVSVRLHIGNSDFGPAQEASPNAGVYGLAGGDISEDASDDSDIIAGTESSTGEVKVYNNNGTGSLSEDNASPYNTLGTEIWAIDSGDMNSDGFLDFIVGTRGNNANNRRIEVWMNRGDGDFTQSGTYIIGFQINAIKLGDMDKDGDLDAVIGVRTTSNNDGQVEVWLNDGAGSLSEDPNSPFKASGNVLDLDLADMDQDDTTDIVMAIRTGNTTGEIQIILKE